MVVSDMQRAMIVPIAVQMMMRRNIGHSTALFQRPEFLVPSQHFLSGIAGGLMSRVHADLRDDGLCVLGVYGYFVRSGAIMMLLLIGACTRGDDRTPDSTCQAEPPTSVCEEGGEFYHTFQCGNCAQAWFCAERSEGVNWGKSNVPCACIGERGHCDSSACECMFW